MLLKKGVIASFVGNSVSNTQKLQYVYVSQSDIVLYKLTKQCAPTRLVNGIHTSENYERITSIYKKTVYL